MATAFDQVTFLMNHPTEIVLRIVTPVTRMENLKAIQSSFPDYRECPGVAWWWRPFIDASVVDQFCPIGAEAQPTRVSGIAGHVHRNTLLMIEEASYRLYSIFDPWIMSLDDDNILHPDLFRWLSDHRYELQNYSGIIFDQVNKDGSLRLKADPDKVTVGNIDTAQYMFRASIVQGLRFDESRYDADGVFIEELYQRHKDKFLFVNQPLCYYNYLRS